MPKDLAIWNESSLQIILRVSQKSRKRKRLILSIEQKKFQNVHHEVDFLEDLLQLYVLFRFLPLFLVPKNFNSQCFDTNTVFMKYIFYSYCQRLYHIFITVILENQGSSIPLG